MGPAGPFMPNMFVPLVQQGQQGSRPGGRRTNAGPMQQSPQPASAMRQQVCDGLTCAFLCETFSHLVIHSSLQMLPRGRGYRYPPGGMFSVQYEMGGLPLRDVGISQPIPIGALASALANASPTEQRMVSIF